MMTEERLAQLERLGTPGGWGVMVDEMVAEVRRCWRLIAELQAERRKAEAALREAAGAVLRAAGDESVS